MDTQKQLSQKLYHSTPKHADYDDERVYSIVLASYSNIVQNKLQSLYYHAERYIDVGLRSLQVHVWLLSRTGVHQRPLSSLCKAWVCSSVNILTE